MAAKIGKILLKIWIRNIEMAIASTYININKNSTINEMPWFCGPVLLFDFHRIIFVGGQSSGDEEEMYDAK